MTAPYYAQAKEMIESAIIYVPANCEGIRIESTDEETFTGVGEETGCEYEIWYSEVDLENDLIYRLELMNPKKEG